MEYKKSDVCTYTTTYGHLRKWAEECSQVKEWMEKHLPKKVFELAQPAFKPGHIYKMRHTGESIPAPGKFLCSAVSGVNYLLVNINGASYWGSPGTLEELSQHHGSQIAEDLGKFIT